MKRWNGWGDAAKPYPLADSAVQYLTRNLGELSPSPDASYRLVVQSAPESRLPYHPVVDSSAETRLAHARGHSLPDWIALRSGQVGCYPDGVVFPQSGEDVQEILRFARQHKIRLIPYGGGTSVVGHINPLPDEQPVMSVDMSRMAKLLELDETSYLARFQAGVSGPELEKQLNQRGFTLGHYPQSFEFSTLGGWVSARSSGQQSYHYGRIEALFAGGVAETPQGRWDFRSLPASAAGPDLRQLFLGSEGRLGILTEAELRVRPLAGYEAFYGIFLPDWAKGIQAVKKIAQERLQVSMLRLSDAAETESTLILSGKDELVKWAERGLRLLRYGAERCLLIFGVTGERGAARQAHRQVETICREHGGLPAIQTIGELWRKNRFRTPYLRNTLWETGIAVDTLETALPWRQVAETAQAIRQAITGALGALGEAGIVFTHLSHVYPDGASIYTTFLFRRCADPDELLGRWQALKTAASLAILEHGGTISHQHGVGIDHASYLPLEKGAVGIQALHAACRALDPDGLMNPGKLLPQVGVG